MQNCVCSYFVPLLLHRIGNLLAYVAALFVTSFCRLLTVRGREVGRETPNLEVVGCNPVRR